MILTTIRPEIIFLIVVLIARDGQGDAECIGLRSERKWPLRVASRNTGSGGYGKRLEQWRGRGRRLVGIANQFQR